MSLRVKSTGESSAKFGPCEVCAKRVSDVYIRRIGSDHAFGHEQCVSRPGRKVRAAVMAFRDRYHGAP